MQTPPIPFDPSHPRTPDHAAGPVTVSPSETQGPSPDRSASISIPPNAAPPDAPHAPSGPPGAPEGPDGTPGSPVATRGAASGGSDRSEPGTDAFLDSIRHRLEARAAENGGQLDRQVLVLLDELTTTLGAGDAVDVSAGSRAARRLAGLERRTVRVGTGTVVRARLLATIVGCPVERAFLNAVPTFLASGEVLHRFPTVRKDTIPDAGGDRYLTVSLPPETWHAVRERAKQEGVRMGTVLDAAIYPYLPGIQRAVSAAANPHGVDEATPDSRATDGGGQRHTAPTTSAEGADAHPRATSGTGTGTGTLGAMVIPSRTDTPRTSRRPGGDVR